MTQGKPMPLLSDAEITWRSMCAENGVIIASETSFNIGAYFVRDIYESARQSDLAKIEALTKLAQELVDRGDALVKRWDSPLWRDLPHTATFIHALRDTVESATKLNIIPTPEP